MVEHTMDVSGWLRKQLEDASPDLLRMMVKDFAEALMSADADAVCGVGYVRRRPLQAEERVIANRPAGRARPLPRPRARLGTPRTMR